MAKSDTAVSIPLADSQPQALAAPEVNLAGMFERLAQNPDINVDKLQVLVTMQRDIMGDNARAAFNTAFSQMQAALPVIIASAKADKFQYAPLEDIIERVRPILARFRFGLSHRSEWPVPGTVKVVGVLTHADGHERQSEFLSPADTSGSKNAVQALASTVSYGRRYTTLDLLNIVTRGEDDDAKRAARQQVPDGYDEWLMALTDKASEGLGPLQDMWRVATSNDDLKVYPLYLRKHEPHVWNQLKKQAAQVKGVE